MLTSEEKRVLEVINSRLLITEKELNSILNNENMNGGSSTVKKLMDSGYVDRVHSLGTCIVITQKGMRALNKT